MPGIASNRGEPPRVEEPERRGGSGDGGGERPRHPFIEGLLRTLPDPDSETEGSVLTAIRAGAADAG
jgi:hypothetical protein